MLPRKKQEAVKVERLKQIALLLILIIISSSLIKISGFDRQKLSPAEQAMKELFAPLQNGVISVYRKCNDFFGFFVDMKKLQRENQELQETVGQLNSELATMKEVVLENQRLRKLLDVKSQLTENFEMVTATIIARDPGNWNKTVTLNMGSLEGIQKNMAVMNHEGLVGRIINVTPNTSEVLLILDNEGAVGARIQENRIALGVVEGIGDESGLLQLIHLPHDADVAEGQTVISSGLGGVFPRGLQIGKIIRVELEPDGLLKKAVVEPFVDFIKLEEVLIIKNVIKIPDLPEDNTIDKMNLENETIINP